MDFKSYQYNYEDKTLTSFSNLLEHVLSASCGSEQLLKVRWSMAHRANVLGQFVPKLDTVLSNVMYVPPTAGSDTLAKNAITATNMQ